MNKSGVLLTVQIFCCCFQFKTWCRWIILIAGGIKGNLFCFFWPLEACNSVQRGEEQTPLTKGDQEVWLALKRLDLCFLYHNKRKSKV